MNERASGEPLLEVERLSKTFDDGQVHAVDNVSFSVAAGEYVAIMGPSGCGKSTLLNLLGALEAPTSGEIRYRQKSLAEWGDLDAFRARELGFVFQSFHLLPVLSALENVQVPMFESPLPAHRRTVKAAELLELVGMSKRANHLPLKLSVGERQRVALARALANDPQLLLADEPTGNLDSVTAHGVFDLFDQLVRDRGMTIMMVTHDAELASRAGRAIRMKDGRIVSPS